MLRAANPAALERFYLDALGLSFEKRQGELAQLRAGNALIDIVPSNEAGPAGGTSSTGEAKISSCRTACSRGSAESSALPNVIASPHNSGQGGDAHDIALRRAVENCRRALTGKAPLHVIGLDERLM